MNIILAKTAGFCFGVKRAVKMAEELAGRENVYTLGPLIHNRHVTEELAEKGISMARVILENSLAHYGFKSLEEAEAYVSSRRKGSI